MGWFIAAGLALAAFALIAWMTSWKSEGWLALGAALLAALAGYAAQGRPGLAGSPRAAAASVYENPAALVEARLVLSGRNGLPSDTALLTADAYVRNGRFAEAVDFLRGAVEKQPGNSEAWLALANALVAHAEGTLSPAALYAYRRSAEVAPEAPGPPWFLGLALAQSGQFGQARAIWAQLLVQAPRDAAWRADLAEKIQRLDALIARQQAMGTGG
ncbi:MAG: tetratricopeptide repeat protein [Novosphingobium sp.]